MVTWKPHTEHPDMPDGLPVSVLVAYPGDDDGGPVLAGGPYYFRDGQFLSEEYDEPPVLTPFFWVLESEVVADVPRPPANPDDNPFKSGVYSGVQTYTMAAEDRVRAVKKFDRAQCHAALRVEGLQKTVERAIAARLRQLDREGA